MKIPTYGYLCTCSNCGCALTAKVTINLYLGSGYYCSNCKSNVDKELYGK